MLGLMQNWPLTVDKILDHAANWHADREIVSRSIEGPIVRSSYGEVHTRAKKLSNALKALGVVPGDRRQYKSVAAAQAYAFLCGADEVRTEHLEVLATVLWDEPTEQPEKCAKVVARIANPTGMRVNQLLLECEKILAATEVRNLGQAAAASTKLQEIEKQLGSLPGDPRASKARAYVRDQLKRIRLASIDAI